MADANTEGSIFKEMAERRSRSEELQAKALEQGIAVHSADIAPIVSESDEADIELSPAFEEIALTPNDEADEAQIPLSEEEILPESIQEPDTAIGEIESLESEVEDSPASSIEEQGMTLDSADENESALDNYFAEVDDIDAPEEESVSDEISASVEVEQQDEETELAANLPAGSAEIESAEEESPENPAEPGAQSDVPEVVDIIETTESEEDESVLEALNDALEEPDTGVDELLGEDSASLSDLDSNVESVDEVTEDLAEETVSEAPLAAMSSEELEVDSKSVDETAEEVESAEVEAATSHSEAEASVENEEAVEPTLQTEVAAGELDVEPEPQEIEEGVAQSEIAEEATPESLIEQSEDLLGDAPEGVEEAEIRKAAEDLVDKIGPVVDIRGLPKTQPSRVMSKVSKASQDESTQSESGDTELKRENSSSFEPVISPEDPVKPAAPKKKKRVTLLDSYFKGL